jgi:hypothetical protein
MMNQKAIMSERLLRTTDPDVFTNPDSARVRARQLGCIGIRRYGTRGGENGGMAWMPCTNESDYRRRIGIGPQARRDIRKREDDVSRRIARQIRGKSLEIKQEQTDKNTQKFNLDIPENVSKIINNMVRNHNKNMSGSQNYDYTRTNYGDASNVWRRGYSIALRSGMDSAAARREAMRRLRSFFKMLESNKMPDIRSYRDRSDLPEGHPLKPKRFIQNQEQKTAQSSNYTDNELRERLKRKIMAGSKGGKPGQWSARKAQLLAIEYEKAGGRYRGRPKRQQQSLKKWTNEKWRTRDGKPAIRKGGTRRYLPSKAWDSLTPGQQRATDRKKIENSKKGKQFVANTRAAERASKNSRSS